MIGLSPHWLALPTIIASPVPRHPKRVPSTLKMGPPPLFPVEVYPHLLLDSIPTYIPVHPSVCQSGSQYVRMAYIAFKCPNIVRPWLNRSIAPGGARRGTELYPHLTEKRTFARAGMPRWQAVCQNGRQGGTHRRRTERRGGPKTPVSWHEPCGGGNERLVARALRYKGARGRGGSSGYLWRRGPCAFFLGCPRTGTTPSGGRRPRHHRSTTNEQGQAEGG